MVLNHVNEDPELGHACQPYVILTGLVSHYVCSKADDATAGLTISRVK